MTNAGWYPDPAGAPDTYRYWDGQSWSQMTTTRPPDGAAPTPPAGAPSGGYGALPPTTGPTPGPTPYGGQPGQPGQPGGPWGPTPPAPPAGGGGGSGRTVAIVVASVVALVLVGLGGFFGVRALAGDDDSSRASDRDSSKATDDGTQDSTDGTDSTDDPTASGGTDDPTGGPSTSSTIRPVGIQCTGGDPEPAKDPGAKVKMLTGGGLMVPRPRGFEASISYSRSHSFADDIIVAVRSAADNWINEIALGGLPRANGFTSPEQAAEIVMQCLTTNTRIYSDFESRTDLTNEAIKVDGRDAWQITSELRVSDTSISVEGDVTTVVVVDTGDKAHYGLFLSAATIGEKSEIALAERTLRRVTLD